MSESKGFCLNLSFKLTLKESYNYQVRFWLIIAQIRLEIGGNRPCVTKHSCYDSQSSEIVNQES